MSTAAHSDSCTLALSPALPRGRLQLLFLVRYFVLRNRLRQGLRERPLKLMGTLSSVLLIWVGLYFLLFYIFLAIRRPVLEGIVATPLIFTFFFLALTGMLAFSSAILSYSALFRRPESAYLLASPLDPLELVIVNYLETLLLSSWSLILLGIPLMFAMARVFDEPWSFYPLFLGLFLAFIPMPGAFGLLLAWLAAVVFPKTPKRMIVWIMAVTLLISAWWVKSAFAEPAGSNLWLKGFYDRVTLIQGAMLPHNWVSRGINYALQGQTTSAAFYLFVTLANALFMSVIAVTIVSRGFIPAFAAGQSSGARNIRRSGRWITWVSEILFAYMPANQRLLACKDLKTFFRDPLQWSQMAILFGLLMLYVSNVHQMLTEMAEPRLQLLIAFLNLTAVSLILATFTNRFIFPLVSLDGQHLWLLGLLPLPRSRIVIAKFQYALTLTLIAALAVMAVSLYRLGLSRPLVISHLIAGIAICIGLCGVTIGMGARLPVFHERNPARIAGGFGGTVSLLLSVALVVASLVCMGLMSFAAVGSRLGDEFTPAMIAWLTVLVIVNVVAAGLSLFFGIRHFNHVEY